MLFERVLLEKQQLLVEKTGYAYRYGFQGQESDDEVKGEGNSVNYKYRMHDPRVGRFFAVDPLAPDFPWYSPYQFSGNQVISFRELEGLEEFRAYDKGDGFYEVFWDISERKKGNGGTIIVFGTSGEVIEKIRPLNPLELSHIYFQNRLKLSADSPDVDHLESSRSAGGLPNTGVVRRKKDSNERTIVGRQVSLRISELVPDPPSENGISGSTSKAKITLNEVKANDLAEILNITASGLVSFSPSGSAIQAKIQSPKTKVGGQSIEDIVNELSGYDVKKITISYSQGTQKNHTYPTNGPKAFGELLTRTIEKELVSSGFKGEIVINPVKVDPSGKGSMKVKIE